MSDLTIFEKGSFIFSFHIYGRGLGNDSKINKQPHPHHHAWTFAYCSAHTARRGRAKEALTYHAGVPVAVTE